MILFQQINANPKDKQKSFYKKSITRIKISKSGKINKLAKKKGWRISRKDLKTLKQIDKRVIKNVRCAINKK